MVLGIPEYRLARGLIDREIDAILELGIDVETVVPGRRRRHDRGAPRPPRRAVPRGRHRTGPRPRSARPRARRRAARRRVPPQRQPGLPRRPRRARRRRRRRQRRVRRRPHRAARRSRRAGARRAGRSGAADRHAGRRPARHDDHARRRPCRRPGRRARRDRHRARVARGDPRRSRGDRRGRGARASRSCTAQGPHRFVGDDGRVTGLETIDVRSVFDDEGRFNPTFVPDTEAVLPADTVILAVGQAADLEVPRRRRARAAAAAASRSIRLTLRTSHPRIWAGGDVAHGPRNLIDAIADGQRAAAVDPRRARRRGRSAGDGVHVELHRRPGFRRLVQRATTPSPASRSRRRRPSGGSASPRSRSATTTEDAWLESLRCLRCFDNVMLDPSCASCAACASTSARRTASRSPAPTRSGSATESQSVLLLDEDLCIRCGLCVNRCPPGALSMVHAREVVDD